MARAGTGCAWLDLRALSTLGPEHFTDGQTQLFASLGVTIATAEDEPVFSGVPDGRDWSQTTDLGAGGSSDRGATSRSGSRTSVRGF